MARETEGGPVLTFFEHLPSAYSELASARDTVMEDMTPFMAHIRNRFTFTSGREKANIGGKQYDVRKTSSALPTMSFYAESEDALRLSDLIISTDPGRNRIERVEYIETATNKELSVQRFYSEVDFRGNRVRIAQDISNQSQEAVDDQHFEVDGSSMDIARLISVVDGQEAVLFSVRPQSESIAVGRTLTTDLRTGTRTVGGKNNEAISLPPTDILLTHMIHRALKLQRVSLDSIPRS